MPSPTPPAWEQEILSLFVGIFETFGLPKSTAMIYGTLYCAEKPMLQEEICARLGISAGSASQGLKLLQSLGAVHREQPGGRRHSQYTAELSVRRLISHFIDIQLLPKLENGQARLKALSRELPAGNDHARQRIQTLQSWQNKVTSALPLATRLLGTPSKR
jgi:DNA-binding transcriptional regulator GbsR (MarR family)